MNYAEYSVLDFFNANPNFIMYAGGSGGEHLVIKLKQYSDMFRDPNIKYNSVPNKNRWMIDANPFELAIASEYSSRWKSRHVKDWSPIEFARLIIDNMSRKFSYTEVCRIIDNSINSIENSNGKSLFRKHLSGYSCFTDSNTYLITCNSSWVEYSRHLFAYKALMRKYKNEEDILFRLRRVPFYLSDRKDMLTDYVKNFGMDSYEMNEAKIALICSTNKYSISQILPMDLEDASIMYVKANMDIETKVKDLNESPGFKIDMLQLFDKSYMEDLFHINDSQFHEDMLIWHERNLELLSSHGHDITEWKLK